MKGLKRKTFKKIIALVMAAALLIGMAPDATKNVLAEAETTTAKDAIAEQGITSEGNTEGTSTEETETGASDSEKEEVTEKTSDTEEEDSSKDNEKDTSNQKEDIKPSDSTFRFVETKTENETVKEYSATYDTDAQISMKAKSDENGDNARKITYDVVKFIDGKGNIYVKNPAEDSENETVVENFDDFIELLPVESDGKVNAKIKSAGTATITATIEGNEALKETTISCQIKIKKAKADVKFYKEQQVIERDTVTYGESYQLTAKSENAKNIQYSLKNEADKTYAEIENQTGKITVKKPKNEEIVFVATATDDKGNYEGKAEFCLETKKADRKVEFKEKEIFVYYGDHLSEEISNSLSVSDSETIENITYSIWDLDNQDESYATVTKDGKVKINAKKFQAIKEEYSIKVKAEISADDYYNEAEIFYTIVVKRAEKPEKTYRIEGTKEAGSKYYKSNVVVHAPDGYKISLKDDIAEDGWSDSLEFQQTTENIIFYLKNSDGNITGQISLEENIYIDTQLPEMICTCSAIPLYQKSNLYLNNADTTIQVTAKDNEEISVLTYQFDSGPSQIVTETSDDNKKLIQTEIPIKFMNERKTISFTAKDTAGNMATQIIWGDDEENKLNSLNVITDDKAPELNITYNTPVKEIKETEDIKYYKGEADVTLEMKEPNFNKDWAVVEISRNNGEKWDKLSLDWNQYNDKAQDSWFATIPALKEDGTYQIKINCTDYAGNKMDETFSSKIIIDTKAPESAITLPQPKNIVKDNEKINGNQYQKYLTDADAKLYYDKEVTAVISITENNFNADAVKVSVNGQPASLVNAEWSKAADRDVYTNEIKLSQEGVNVISVDYNDYSENTMKLVSAKIVVDTTAPEKAITLPQPKNIVKDNEKINGNQYQKYLTDAEAKLYYDEEVTAVISITEDNFNAGDVKAFVNGQSVSFVNEEWSKAAERNVYTNEIKLSQEGVNVISVEYKDYSENTMEKLVSAKAIIDTVDPAKNISFDRAPNNLFQEGKEISEENWKENGAWKDYIENDAVTFKYTSGLKVILTVTEDNFDANAVTVTKNGEEVREVTWIQQSTSNVWKAEIQVTEKGVYQYQVSGTDYAGRYFTGTSAQIDVNLDSISRTITLSQPKKVVTDNEGTEGGYIPGTEKVSEKFYYGQNSENDKKDGMTFTVAITDTDSSYDKNNFGQSVTACLDGEEEKELKFDQDEWTKTGNTYTNTITLAQEGEYVVKINHQNTYNVSMPEYTSPFIIIDKTSPERTVTLGAPKNIVDKDRKKVEYTDETKKSEITDNRFYYKEEAKIHLAITEKHFYEKDVTVQVNGENYVLTEAWKKDEGDVYTNDITLKENGTYVITMEYTDKSENKMKSYTSPVIIVDDKNPERTITLGQPNKVVDKSRKEVEYTDEIKVSEITDNRFYYKEQAEIDLAITETNFYYEDVIVKVNDDTYALKQAWKKGDGDVYTNHITLEENGTYVITMEYTDKSENKMKSYTSPVIIVDDKNPERTITLGQPNKVVDKSRKEVEYTDEIKVSEITDNRFYYKEQAEIDLAITETNFYYEDVVVKVNDDTYALKQEWKKGDGDVYTNHITLEENGTYVITMEYTDKSGNAMVSYTSPKIIVDDKIPERTVEFSKPQNILDAGEGKDNAKVALNDNFNTDYAYDQNKVFHYNGKDTVTVTLHIDETYFYYEDVAVKVNGKEVKVPVKDEAVKDEDIKLNGEWIQKENSDIYTNSITLEAEGEYIITMEYTDKSGNVMVGYTSPKIVIDEKKPERKVRLSKTSTGKVFVKRQENLAQDEYLEETYDNDNADSENQEDRFYYTVDNPAILTISIDEKYFFNTNKADVKVEITKDGEKLQTDSEEYKDIVKSLENDWKQADNVWTNTLTIAKEGFYVVTITYADPANNKMDTYTSPQIYVDATAPVMKTKITKPDKAVYGNDSEEGENKEISLEEEQLNNLLSTISNPNTNENQKAAFKGEKFYYNTEAKIDLEIAETNFYSGDVVVRVTQQADNQTGAKEIGTNNIYTVKDWKLDSETNTYKNQISLTENGIYVITITYTDKSGNEMGTYISPRIFIDHNAPTDMSVNYKGTDIANYYYYNDRVELELNASDAISGIDHFKWVYVPEEGISDVNVRDDSVQAVIAYLNENITYRDSEGSSAVAKFIVPIPQNSSEEMKEALKQLRGHIKFTVWDRAQNEADYIDAQKSIVVDNISPVRTVKLSQPKQVVSRDTLNTKKNYSLSTEAEQSGNSDSILYYDTEAVVQLNINEANFYAEDINVYVNGEKKDVTWSHTTKDNYAATVSIHGDGDYIVRMTYTDRSGNVMRAYQSDKIVIDTIRPVLDVDYSIDKPQNTINGREYFNANQKVTITVNEHNFRADDVKTDIVAKDVTGKDINVKLKGGNGKEINVSQLDAYLSDRGNWSSNGDVHIATFTYVSDANYTFDISYNDLALRETVNYKKDQFTVDKKAPSKLKVSYSTSVLENIIRNISFGYYNAKVTVTISAEDDISGVNKFVYSYIKSENVSNVNAELIDKAIRRAKITQNGNVFTAQFKIPKNVLKENNQFNGKVKFASYDKSDNSKEKRGNKRIVVDNIAPKMDIKYNKPVSSRGNTDYYSGNIEATIHVTEANFYAQDVKVLVARNGGRGSAANVKWSNQGTDNHTGTFTVSGDGDYVVSVEYVDRSSNRMKSYKSKQMTIDTKTPTLNVSKVKANSANKDKTYSFAITANDQNFDISSFHPELSYVAKNGNGKFVTKTITLNPIKTSGKNYIISIDNLEEDGIYTLTSNIRDYANHSYGKIRLDDGKEYDSVRFSINRNGSVFTVDENTMDNVNKYYIYSVDNDVIIRETNVDPVEKFTVKLNNRTLTEGKDYTTSQSNGNEKWSVRTYTIKKSLFEEEGEYQIVVESIDKTGTSAYSDVKNLNLSFVVDKKAPVLTISGLEKGGRYQVGEQTVVVGVSDDGGKPYSFRAIVLDRSGDPLLDANGKDISVRISMEGEEFEKYLQEHGNKVTFTIPEGLENQVKIICDDYVRKADTNEYNQIFEKVTVSQSSLVIFYANKPLLYSLIAVVVIIIAGIIIFIVLKRKKKQEKKAAK